MTNTIAKIAIDDIKRVQKFKPEILKGQKKYWIRYSSPVPNSTTRRAVQKRVARCTNTKVSWESADTLRVEFKFPKPKSKPVGGH